MPSATLRLRIATRKSALARTQSGWIARRLEEVLGANTELVPVVTQGDRILDQPLAEIGGKGLFIKEVEEALLDGRADLAVHSAKDLPAALDPAFVIAAFPERVDPRDALVARAPGVRLETLPRGARVGTGSVRRRAQLLAARPDLEIVGIRGNVDTRLRKLEEEGMDAVILACAGLERLGLAERISERLDASVMLPAVCQGQLAVEACAGSEVAQRLAALDDGRAREAAEAERSTLAGLDADCNVPLAAWARQEDDTLVLDALLSDLDGRTVLRTHQDGARGDARRIGERAARELLAAGGEAILRELRGAADA